MRKTIKQIVNYSMLILALVTVAIFGCNCSTTKPYPLAGWQKNYTLEPTDQIIEKDYQSYIRSLSPAEQKFIGPVFYYHNETGQRAVRIEVDINGTDCWYHILFYDKENKRIKVIKYFYGRYVS